VIWLSFEETVFPKDSKIKFYQLSKKNIFLLIYSIVKSLLIVFKEKPEIIHFHSLGIYSLPLFIINHKKIVSTPWGTDILFGSKKIIKKIILKSCLRKSALISCDAEHMKKKLLLLDAEKQKIKLINFGIDTKKFKVSGPRPLFLPVKKRLIISTRNHEEIYNIESLIRAIPLIITKFPDVIFLIYGEGSKTKSYKKLVLKLNVQNYVFFPGKINQNDLPLVLSSADIYVSTSLSDAGIAASTAEAMACERAVVITNSGENNKWVQNGENGYLVPTKRSDQIAKYCKKLLADNALRTRLGSKARKTIIDRNDYINEMNKMQSYYLDLINDKSLQA
jgi:glycosyltransferase involved in cell wall biosynthesis